MLRRWLGGAAECLAVPPVAINCVCVCFPGPTTRLYPMHVWEKKADARRHALVCCACECVSRTRVCLVPPHTAAGRLCAAPLPHHCSHPLGWRVLIGPGATRDSLRQCVPCVSGSLSSRVSFLVCVARLTFMSACKRLTGWWPLDGRPHTSFGWPAELGTHTHTHKCACTTACTLSAFGAGLLTTSGAELRFAPSQLQLAPMASSGFYAPWRTSHRLV